MTTTIMATTATADPIIAANAPVDNPLLLVFVAGVVRAALALIAPVAEPVPTPLPLLVPSLVPLLVPSLVPLLVPSLVPLLVPLLVS